MIKIEYDGTNVTKKYVNDDTRKPCLLFTADIGYVVITDQVFGAVKLPTIKNISIICEECDADNMVEDLQSEYISLKESFKERIYKNL